MSVELNHTIVSAHDKLASADFLADILGVPVGDPVGPFVPVQLGNGVTLDYMDSDAPGRNHYAFLVDDATFDAAYARLTERGIQIWADPGHEDPDVVNTRWGGRGLYFLDPAGHNMEIMTAVP
jgi:catechol 2,3-dioxygenase-like lactoylglutathione lyase family enzyme